MMVCVCVNNPRKDFAVANGPAAGERKHIGCEEVLPFKVELYYQLNPLKKQISSVERFRSKVLTLMKVNQT
jgi:hypothetical protein